MQGILTNAWLKIVKATEIYEWNSWTILPNFPKQENTTVCVFIFCRVYI